MTSTPDLRPLGGCDDPASVLGYARERKSTEDQAAREVMIAGAKYASMHTEDSLVGPVESWHESCLPLGGPGCPGVAEFAVTEFAAALGQVPGGGSPVPGASAWRGSTGSRTAGNACRPVSCRRGGWG